MASFYANLRITQDIREVSGKIKHAILARYPRRRYVTGRDGKASVLMSHTPTLVLDWFFSTNILLLGPKKKSSK